MRLPWLPQRRRSKLQAGPAHPVLCPAQRRPCTVRRYGLDVPLLARLEAGGLMPHLLELQYRMHPDIAAFPSSHFYGGRVMSGVAAEDRPLLKVRAVGSNGSWSCRCTPSRSVAPGGGAQGTGGGARGTPGSRTPSMCLPCGQAPRGGR